MIAFAHHRRSIGRATVPAAFLQYLPANLSTTGWVNTGSGGSAYNLVLPSGVTPPTIVPGPNGVPALRFTPSSYFQTVGSLPASLCGQSPRTVALGCQLENVGFGALCGWGSQAYGGAGSDFFVYQGAITDHVYGALASIHELRQNQPLMLYARQQQIPAGWSIQAGSRPTPESVLSTPAVNTAATPFYLGKGAFGDRDGAELVWRAEVWPAFNTDVETAAYNDQSINLYGTSL